MSCRLCGEPKPLKNSHIVPEYFYKESYDKKGRAHKFWSDESAPNPRVFVQKGLREKLLRFDCEQVLNNSFENKFKIFWYDDEYIPRNIEIGSNLKRQFDPSLLVGLLLSVVWRANVVDSLEFALTNIGEKH